jgi:wyosine [tRNA(Phe)-imidazoG37] synthetase (radical SAM superfamily)
MREKRDTFYNSEEVFKETKHKVKEAKGKGEPIDYLAFVPDGEPTLDNNLGREIELLKGLGIKIAVISNASLIWREDVQDDLSRADWVSLKIDAITKDIWGRINRPHRSLQFDKILQGIVDFSNSFKGKLATETMLIQEITDNRKEFEMIADFIAGVKPDKAYISIPTRPPAEKWVRPATEHEINMAYQIFSKRSIDVEYLVGYEGNAFAFTGNTEDDLLSITSVHPMREDCISEFLKKANANWNIIEKLIEEDKLLELRYRDKKFYMRKLPGIKREKANHHIRKKGHEI